MRREEGKYVFVVGTLGGRGLSTGVCRKEGARGPTHTAGERPKEKERTCAVEGTLREGERGRACACTIES